MKYNDTFIILIIIKQSQMLDEERQYGCRFNI